jgi:hypothetical protein
MQAHLLVRSYYEKFFLPKSSIMHVWVHFIELKTTENQWFLWKD